MIRLWAVASIVAFGLGTPTQGHSQLSDTIEKVKPSILAVGTFQKTRNPPFVFRGTGFVVADGTLVATNAHVVPEKIATESGEALIVIASSGGQLQRREAAASVVDADHDLAVLKITGPALPALELIDTPAVREGQTFGFTGFPIGNILGLTPVTHRAMISAVTPIVLPMTSAKQLDSKAINRLKTGPFSVYQLDGTAYPGNSGSPLYDLETGRVVGVINMVFVRGSREAALNQPSGISFAIPIRHLRELLARKP
ncbi:MAG TPA: serine protease [Burkholderiales bacterium]|nr:serine protease [Burkholderiales bacterium]